MGRRYPNFGTKHPKGKGKTYRNIILQEDLFPKAVRELQPSSVLEVGCGFGRMSALVSKIPSVKVYHAIDISPDRISEARRTVTGVKFMQGDFLAERFFQKYALVFACEVVMHIPPATVRAFLMKMRDLSKRHVMDLDYYDHSNHRHLEPHNFNHQYRQIYFEIGAHRVTEKVLERKRLAWTERYFQSIFLADFGGST